MTDVAAKAALPEFVSKTRVQPEHGPRFEPQERSTQQPKEKFSRVLDKETRNRSDQQNESRSGTERSSRSQHAERSRSERSEKAERSNEPRHAERHEKDDADEVARSDQTAGEQSDSQEQPQSAQSETTAATDKEAVEGEQPVTDVEAELLERENTIKQLAALFDVAPEELDEVVEHVNNKLLEAIMKRAEHLSGEGDHAGMPQLKPEVLADLQAKWSEQLQQHLLRAQAKETGAETEIDPELVTRMDQLSQRFEQLLKAQNRAGEEPLKAQGLVRALATELVSHQGLQKGQDENGELSEELIEQSLDDAMAMLEAIPEEKFEQLVKTAKDAVAAQPNVSKMAMLEKQIATDMMDSLGVRPLGEAMERTQALNSMAHIARPGAPQNTPSMLLQPAIQDSEWGAVFNQRIAMMVRNEMNSAELRLNPPELGAVAVKIQMAQDAASVTFSSAHGNVREAIEAALPRLREMLAESGVSLNNVDINAGQKQQEQFTQQMNDQQGGNGHGGEGAAGEEAELAEADPTSRVIVTDSLVDAYV